MLAAIIIACASIIVGIANVIKEFLIDKKMKKCEKDKQAMRDRIEELEKEVKHIHIKE